MSESESESESETKMALLTDAYVRHLASMSSWTKCAIKNRVSMKGEYTRSG